MRPNFKLEPGYHHTICASVNDEVVHGIPGARILEPGDILSVDSGAILQAAGTATRRAPSCCPTRRTRRRWPSGSGSPT